MNFTRRIWEMVRAAELPVPQPGGTFFAGLHLGDVNPTPELTRQQKLEVMAGWVYAAVDAIVTDIASAEWTLYRGDNEVEAPPELSQPNDLMTFEGVMETTQLHLDLVGEAYWNLIRTSPVEKAIGFQIVYPHWIERPLIEEGKFKGWRLNVAGAADGTKFIAKEDMVFFRYPHPKNPLIGMSPVAGFATSHSLDLNTRGYASALMGNNAVPALLISTDQDLTPEQSEDIQTRWVERYGNRPGDPAVLGRGAKVQLLGLTLEKLGIGVIDRITRDQVFGTYGVPASKKGLVEDVNRANAASNERTYQKNVILPRLSRLALGTNRYALPALGLDGHTVKFSSPVMEDKDFLLEKAKTTVQIGIETINGARAMLDMEEVPDGNVFLVPANVTRVPAGQLAEPEAPDPKGVQRQTHVMEDPIIEFAEEAFLRESDRLERWMVGQLRRVFSLEQKAVIKQVREHWDEIVGEARRVKVWELRGPVAEGLAETNEGWNVLLYTAAVESSRAGWQITSKMLEKQGLETFPWADIKAAADTRARRWAAFRITEISKTTAKEVRAIIRKAIEEGKSVDAVARELAAKYDQFRGARAKTIARTEVTSNLNWGEYKTATETIRKTGQELTKTWVTILDGRERDTHRIAHNQTVDADEVFRVGGASLRWPGDNAPAKETINCRCTLAWKKKRVGKKPRI